MAELLPRFSVPDPTLAAFDPRPLKPDAEIWLEIGFGGGEHMVAQAASHPDTLIIGAEPFQNGVASALTQMFDQSLGNIRVHMGDARSLVDALPNSCLSRVFVLFPDPWPKARHSKRRLINPASIASLARVMQPSGRLRFATDWSDYCEKTLAYFLASPAFDWCAGRADDWRRPPLDHAPTRYQAKALGDIEPIFLDFMRR